MNEERRLPASLKAVAILFIIGGIFCAIEVIVSLTLGRININLGVLGLFIGPGLLALRSGWRTCALVFIWIALISVPLVLLVMLSSSGSPDLNVFGQRVGHANHISLFHDMI